MSLNNEKKYLFSLMFSIHLFQWRFQSINEIAKFIQYADCSSSPLPVERYINKLLKPQEQEEEIRSHK